MKLSINILFFLFKSKRNSKGDSPIYCRLSFKGTRKQFSIGIKVPPKDWEHRKQRIKNTNSSCSFYNESIQNLKSRIITIQSSILNEGRIISPELILERFSFNEDSKVDTLMKAYAYKEERMKKLVGIDYQVSTIKKFMEVRNHLKSFLLIEKKSKDIQLQSLDLKFLIEFEDYLKVIKKQKPITINKIVQRLKSIIKTCIDYGWLARNPFFEHKPLKEDLVIVYLSDDELFKLKEFQFKQERLNQVRNLFLFSVYTGLAYYEASELKYSNLVGDNEGDIWIKIIRKKTNKMISIPLLDEAKIILKSLKSHSTDYVLPKLSNQKFNSYLKEITDIVGIEKRVTHHTARKTFATTVLLNNDIPIETVSTLLGHSNIRITQKHYAEVLNKKLKKDLKSKLFI